jgi:hypothetical protein
MTPDLTSYAEHELEEPDVNQLVSWWHTDGTWGTVECVDDMTESPYVGSGHSNPRQVHFSDLFGGLRAERLIPASMF